MHEASSCQMIAQIERFGRHPCAHRVLAGLMDAPRDAEAMATPIRALLERPIVGKELASLLKAVSKDPVLAPIGTEAIAGIVADPGFTATLTKLIDAW